jgi:hypothetical protein
MTREESFENKLARAVLIKNDLEDRLVLLVEECRGMTSKERASSSAPIILGEMKLVLRKFCTALDIECAITDEKSWLHVV